MKFIFRILATGFYSGYCPVAPGTAGSALALGIFILIPGFREWILLAVCVGVFFIGVWSATQVEKTEGHDATLIVIDEMVGMWIALLYLPNEMHWICWVIAFFVFRVFDIFKPFPADQSQKLPAGWGVMTDDVIAGIFTNLFVRFVYSFF